METLLHTTLNDLRARFHLDSVEMGKFSGMTVSYSVTTDEGIQEFKTVQGQAIHPDLRSIFQSLRGKAEYALGFPAQEENEDDRYLVNPIGYAASGDKYTLTALINGPVGTYKAKTPKLYLDTDDIAVFDGLEDEVFEYLFAGKSAQLSLFGEAERDDLIAGVEAELLADAE